VRLILSLNSVTMLVEGNLGCVDRPPVVSIAVPELVLPVRTEVESWLARQEQEVCTQRVDGMVLKDQQPSVTLRNQQQKHISMLPH
jgi:hypothetical protein